MLTVPKQFQRSGIKVHCTSCAYQVTTRCGITKRNKATCPHQDKHRYKAIVCVPDTTQRRVRLLDSTDFNIALVEVNNFRKELGQNGFHKTPVTVATPTTISNHSTMTTKPKLVELILDYLDYVSGVNTPSHLVRTFTSQHIVDCRKTLE
jgi:hypothetical protein